MVKISTTLKEAYGVNLRSIVGETQQCLGSYFSQNMGHLRCLSILLPALELLGRLAPAHSTLVNRETQEWIDKGHEAMMESYIVPVQLRYFYSDSRKRVIFIGLADDLLSFYWLDGSASDWAKVPETLHWKPSNGRSIDRSSGHGQSQSPVQSAEQNT